MRDRYLVEMLGIASDLVRTSPAGLPDRRFRWAYWHPRQGGGLGRAVPQAGSAAGPRDSTQWPAVTAAKTQVKINIDAQYNGAASRGRCPAAWHRPQTWPSTSTPSGLLRTRHRARNVTYREDAPRIRRALALAPAQHAPRRGAARRLAAGCATWWTFGRTRVRPNVHHHLCVEARHSICPRCPDPWMPVSPGAGG
jgi:hypothetical protein